MSTVYIDGLARSNSLRNPRAAKSRQLSSLASTPEEPDFPSASHTPAECVKFGSEPIALRAPPSKNARSEIGSSNLMALSDDEKEFLQSFSKKEYKPELLFEDDEIIKRIKNHPMALWKMQHD